MGSMEPLVDRLRRRSEETDAGCWVRQGARDRHGYPFIKVRGKMRLGHRVSYEQHVGPIPDGYEVDHLCFERACVNPDHLEAVTPEVNIDRARKAGRLGIKRSDWTTCVHGHPLSGSNLYVYRAPSGREHFHCRACRREHARQYRRRRAAQA